MLKGSEFASMINPLLTVRLNEVRYEKKDVFSKLVVLLPNVFY